MNIIATKASSNFKDTESITLNTKTNFNEINFNTYALKLYEDLNFKSEYKGITKTIIALYMNLPFCISDQIFNFFNKEKTETLSENDFLELIKVIFYNQQFNIIYFIFKLLDYDNDNTIKRQDLEMFLFHLFKGNQISENEYTLLINELFLNKKTIVSYENFTTFNKVIQLTNLIMNKIKASKYNTRSFKYELNKSSLLIEEKEDIYYSTKQLNSITLNENRHSTYVNGNILYKGLVYVKFPKVVYITLTTIYCIITTKHIFFFSNSTLTDLVWVYDLTNCYIDKSLYQEYYEGIVHYKLTLKFLRSMFHIYSRSMVEITKLSNIIGNILDLVEFQSKYEFINTIGQGHYGKVMLTKNKVTKELYATKIINKENITEKDAQLILNELHILESISHRNVINSIEIIKGYNFIYVITKYYPNGTLENYLQNLQEPLQENQVKNIIRQIVQGIQYLHSKGIIHRDIKPENILIKENLENKNEIIIKLADFGLSRILSLNQKSIEGFGTLGYVAPEILLREPYDFKIDLWSIGIVLYLLCFGTLPFNGRTDHEIGKLTVFQKINLSNYKDYFPDYIINVINLCLEKKADKRITPSEFLESEWFNSKIKK